MCSACGVYWAISTEGGLSCEGDCGPGQESFVVNLMDGVTPRGNGDTGAVPTTEDSSVSKAGGGKFLGKVQVVNISGLVAKGQN